VVGTVDAKVLFNDLIDDFGGAIGLQMMYRGEVYLHTQAIVKASPKVQNKLRSAIGNDRFGQSMEAENIGLEEPGGRISVDRLVAQNEVCHHCEAIFNYKMESKWEDSGRSVRKSMEMSCQGACGIGSGCKRP
jgi:hypothetical protein